MNYETILVARTGPVTTVTLNRPEKMNAVSPLMHEEMQAAFDAFASDAGQFICVVTGAGEKAFCAGSDLKLLHEQRVYPRSGYAGLVQRFDLDKPVIAAVNGFALGGGFEIALACDIVLAAPHATFGLPEPLVGAVAIGGGMHRLARQIGLKPALGILLASKRITATEALALGIVNEIAAADGLHALVQRWVDAILKGAPPAIRATKQMVYRGLDERSLEAAIARQGQYPAYEAWLGSEDLQEGPRAFNEKRPPVWKGR
jgi:crotonobetainyl-CoA hydratase